MSLLNWPGMSAEPALQRVEESFAIRVLRETLLRGREPVGRIAFPIAEGIALEGGAKEFVLLHRFVSWMKSHSGERAADSCRNSQPISRRERGSE